jgi:hypothetical protein
MTLKNTKKIEATDSVTKYGCEFCKREFLRESTVLKHICEYKHRWLEKDRQGNRIGFQAWLQFYLKNSTSKKNRTYEEFIKSAYYTAFVKFGSYCVDINALNVNRFVDWLLKNQVKVDAWNSDNSYNKFLTEYLREEDPLDAIARSIETTITLAESERVLNRDILRYANKNKICYAITTGKISPWMLYQSDSGTKFLDGLDETQVKMIIDYINPELWAIKFIRDMKIVPQVKELLVAVGY